MSREYSDELRADTAAILIPLIAGVTGFAALLAAITNTSFTDSWHLWLGSMLALLGGTIGWRHLKRDRAATGTLIFTAAHLLFFFLVILINWSPNSIVPYFVAVLIIASSMFTQPTNGFITWAVATVLITFGIGNHVEGFWNLLEQIAGPVLVNLFVALAAYFSALEWQFAVESVSALHLKAQRRRDELFAIQEELRQANGRLLSSNEALEKARATAVAERDLRTRFMNLVSHELRTPINTIVNFAHVLGQGQVGDVSTKQVDYLGRIEKSGWHSMSVLNDLLDLAQINAGEFRLRPQMIDLQEVCERAMSSARGLINNPDIDLIRDYPDVWPKLLVDPKRFHQALLNLLGNAAKYTDEGHIALRVRTQEHTATFAVEDTGVGIPEAHHETVFEEFRQLNETPARKRIGTGLGLPISRHLVEQHGGTLTLHSTPGKGSTFTITLPLLENESMKNGKSLAQSQATTVAPKRPF